MNLSKNVTRDLWDYLKNDKSKIGKRVYEWMNRDNLREVIFDGEAWWFTMNGWGFPPKYVFLYIKRWARKNGKTYLYELCPVK